MKKILLTALIILAATTSFAGVSIEKLGEWGTGIYKGITMDGNSNVYCLTEVSGIDIFDVSDPENMIKIGNLPFNYVESLYFDGNTLYLSQGTYGITVVNIENLESPEIITNIPVDGYTYSCLINGNILYVATGSKGLVTYDINNISSPIFLTSFTEETDADGNVDIIFTKAVKLQYNDNKVYVADANTGFSIVDVTDPAAPTLVITYNSFGGIEDFIMEETRLYLQKTSGFRIVNFEDVEAMSTVSGFSTVKRVTGMSKLGDTIFMSDSEYGLTIVDIETEISPTLVEHYLTGGIASGMILVGDIVYMSDNYKGLVAINISDLEAVSTVSNTEDCGFTRSVAISGDNLYVSDVWSGTRIVDKTNLLNPVLVTSIHNNNITNEITSGIVDSNYIYTADSEFGISILDVTVPENTEVLSTLGLNGLALASKEHDSKLYVASEWYGVNIVDISDSVNPVLLGEYRGKGYVYDVDFYGDTLITASGIAGIELVDVTDVSAPLKISSLYTGGYVFDVSVKGDYAFVLDFFKGLIVVDITNTQFPVVVTTVEDIAYSSQLDVKGDYLYLAQGSNGFSIWNISNPAVPVKEISVDTSGSVEYIKADGSNFYVADGNSGKVMTYSFVETTSSKLYVPHVALNGWTTLVNFENSGINNSNALCKAFSDDYHVFTNKVEVQSSNNTTMEINSGKWGLINVDENIAGTITYLQNSTGEAVTLPLLNEVSSMLTIDIPKENNAWVGLAVLNSSEKNSVVTISLFNSKDEKLGETEKEINLNDNVVMLLSSIFTSDIVANGSYVKVLGEDNYTGLIISGDEFGKLYGSVSVIK